MIISWWLSDVWFGIVSMNYLFSRRSEYFINETETGGRKAPTTRGDTV